MNPEELFLKNIKTIERIAAVVCRRNYISGDDLAEFTQDVKYRLIENDYAIFRKFKGDSRLSTYLTTVISRFLQQARVKKWGKWRPSAEAKRLGDKAITLERLLMREGYTFDEAVKILTTPKDSPFKPAELEAMYVSLPLRSPRPVLVPDENTPEIAASDAGAEDRVQARERRRIARAAIETINRVAAAWPAEERLILRMRFSENLKISDIARRLRLDQKKLYKRLDNLFAQLRIVLAEVGIRADDIGALLASGDSELRFDLLGAAEIPTVRPSQDAEGEVAGGGERRL